ncbi:hypothetical protein PGB34_00370 [Xenophilus arseniciresistens]|uniref:Uncharacterized protein n=1 Tax=Xenophilus arseniciresistens TaxID=1283306 RepID=A0AAE3N4L0_9BURK|nr:hypothetical protein [Xenophilus arseniciresistens]MDA7414803.1 hypothetical protein [Xenophilus arseniciresistens]
MKKHLLMMAMGAGLLMAAQAGAMSREEYKVGEDRIAAEYKAATARCEALQNNARDVCEKQAKGQESVARAELEHNFKPGPASARKVAEEKVKAEYEIAREKCDDMQGEAKNSCEKQAKAVESRGMAEVKAMK